MLILLLKIDSTHNSFTISEFVKMLFKSVEVLEIRLFAKETFKEMLGVLVLWTLKSSLTILLVIKLEVL